MSISYVLSLLMVVILLCIVFNIYMSGRPLIRNGIAVIKPELNNGISGTIRFDDVEYEDLNLIMCRISVDLHGVPDGAHGFHIHEKGDVSDGCSSAGSHYNPTNVDHGSIISGHAGDLGNITARDSKILTTLFTANVITDEIIGRTIVLHAKFDDLGKGGNPESLKTGNSGERIACAVIGIA